MSSITIRANGNEGWRYDLSNQDGKVTGLGSDEAEDILSKAMAIGDGSSSALRLAEAVSPLAVTISLDL